MIVEGLRSSGQYSQEARTRVDLPASNRVRNKSLKAWRDVLHDDDVAQAIIDRVLERGRLLRLDGPSVRTLHVNVDDAMKRTQMSKRT